MTEPTLTLKEHLEQASAEGGSLADYARRCGLNPQRLYAHRYQQKARPLTAIDIGKPAPAFVKVTTPTSTSTSTSTLQLTSVQLPNGVSIQLTSDALVEVLPLLKQL